LSYPRARSLATDKKKPSVNFEQPRARYVEKGRKQTNLTFMTAKKETNQPNIMQSSPLKRKREAFHKDPSMAIARCPELLLQSSLKQDPLCCSWDMETLCLDSIF
jgi:hypothetical protein